MRLHPGQLAPTFDVEDMFGKRVTLSDYRGRSVLVSFFRAAVCPLCNLRLSHLIRRYRAYQRAGLEVIAFVESSNERAHHYLDRQETPFPIIADRELKVYAQYGLESSFWGLIRSFIPRAKDYKTAYDMKLGPTGATEGFSQMDGRLGRLPGDFVVGPDGVIRFVYYARDTGDFALFRDIEIAALGRPLPDPS